MPLSFDCPHCDGHTEVEAKYAGSSGPCRHCGKTITIPGAAPVHYDARAKKSSSWGITAVILVGFAFISVFVIGILIALLLPAVQAAREAARRNGCMNNQKQIGLAILNYESANGHYPPAYTTDEEGDRLHSWRVLILPYLENQALFDQFDLDEPWDSPQNLLLSEQMPSVFRCPLDDADSTTDTNYVAIVDPGSIFPGDQSRRMREIRDGTSRTVMVVEMASPGVHWTEPVDLTMAELGNATSKHSGGFNAAFADGSVHFLTELTPELVQVDDGQ